MEGPNDSIAASREAYADFAPYVRKCLAWMGVQPADIPDLCHEVFLILYQRSDQLDEIARVDLWLREVCRRVAAGNRRRAHRKREVLMPDAELSQSADQAAAEPIEDEMLREGERDLVRDALDRLDDESRDLLALHDVGQMPLTELAKLVEHDRKTVRKRLDLARRRFSALMVAEQGCEVAGAPSVARPHVMTLADVEASSVANRASLAGRSWDATPGSPLEAIAGVEVITVTEGVTIGLIGNVVVTVWTGLVDMASIETLATVGPVLIERCGGKVSYLAIVEATIRPPPLAVRKRIVGALNDMGPYVLGYATVVLGGMSWLVRPIMSGLMVLARPRFPMRFFGSLPTAATWLCTHYAARDGQPLPTAALCEAAEWLRPLRLGWNASSPASRTGDGAAPSERRT